MYTIYDYVKYYSKYSTNDIKWNIMDDFICSILVYLPIKPFDEEKTIDELEIYAENTLPTVSFVAPHSLELLSKISNTKRYKDLIVSNFEKILNSDMQFGAAIFRNNEKTIVSYEGTDGSCIGWAENFRICYCYPTITQKEAIKYLNRNLKSSDIDIDIVGHSKGGNMAMVSAMESDKTIFEKITKVYNFDGPGFRENEYNSDKFKRLQRKLVNIVPADSVVGILFNNSNYNVIKSEAKAFYEHDPITWNIYGEFFVEDKLSAISKKLRKTVIKGNKELDSNMLEETIESILQTLNKNYKDKFVINFSDLKTLIKNTKNNNPMVTKYLIQIINTLKEALATRD